MMAVYASAAAVDAEAAAELKEAQEGRRRFMHMFIQQSEAMLRPAMDGAQASAMFLSLTRPEVYRGTCHSRGLVARCL